MSDSRDRIRDLVAQVASAYFSQTQVDPSNIKHVLDQIWSSLENGPDNSGLADATAVAAGSTAVAAGTDEGVQPPRLTPAQIRRSITPDALVSFEDNKPYKTLKRHLASRGLTPDEYRTKWGLPADYPMVAANYSAVRAETAKRTNLGLLGQQARAARRTGRRRPSSPTARDATGAQSKAQP